MEEKEIIKKIEENRKIPEEVKNKIRAQICDCVLSSIIVYTYFIFLKLGMRNIHEAIYLKDLKVFSVSFAVLAIVFLEKSYYGKNRTNLYRGIEILIIAVITMLLQYVLLYLPPKYRIITPMFAVMYNVYYVLKALVMIRKTKRDYVRKSNDIKEIIAKEKSV